MHTTNIMVRTITQLQAYRPTAEQIAALKIYLVAKAYAETIKPIVDAYKQKAFNEFTFYDTYTGEILTQSNDLPLSYGQDWDAYFDRCYELMMTETSLRVPQKDQCPYLIAHQAEITAAGKLIEAMESVTGISLDDAVTSDCYNDVIGLCLKLLMRLKGVV